MLKIYFSASYDEIEAGLKGMREFYFKIFDVNRIPTQSVIHPEIRKTSTKFFRELLKETILEVEEDRNTAIESFGFSTRSSSK